MLALLSFYALPSGGNQKTRWSITDSDGKGGVADLPRGLTASKADFIMGHLGSMPGALEIVLRQKWVKWKRGIVQSKIRDMV